MGSRQVNPIRLRAFLIHLVTVASLIVPFVLAACGPDGGGGGGGAPGY